MSNRFERDHDENLRKIRNGDIRAEDIDDSPMYQARKSKGCFTHVVTADTNCPDCRSRTRGSEEERRLGRAADEIREAQRDHDKKSSRQSQPAGATELDSFTSADGAFYVIFGGAVAIIVLGAAFIIGASKAPTFWYLLGTVAVAFNVFLALSKGRLAFGWMTWGVFALAFTLFIHLHFGDRQPFNKNVAVFTEGKGWKYDYVDVSKFHDYWTSVLGGLVCLALAYVAVRTFQHFASRRWAAKSAG